MAATGLSNVPKSMKINGCIDANLVLSGTDVLSSEASLNKISVSYTNIPDDQIIEVNFSVGWLPDSTGQINVYGFQGGPIEIKSQEVATTPIRMTIKDLNNCLAAGTVKATAASSSLISLSLVVNTLSKSAFFSGYVVDGAVNGVTHIESTILNIKVLKVAKEAALVTPVKPPAGRRNHSRGNTPSVSAVAAVSSVVVEMELRPIGEDHPSEVNPDYNRSGLSHKEENGLRDVLLMSPPHRAPQMPVPGLQRLDDGTYVPNDETPAKTATSSFFDNVWGLLGRRSSAESNFSPYQTPPKQSRNKSKWAASTGMKLNFLQSGGLTAEAPLLGAEGRSSSGSQGTPDSDLFSRFSMQPNDLSRSLSSVVLAPSKEELTAVREESSRTNAAKLNSKTPRYVKASYVLYAVGLFTTTVLATGIAALAEDNKDLAIAPAVMGTLAGSILSIVACLVQRPQEPFTPNIVKGFAFGNAAAAAMGFGELLRLDSVLPVIPNLLTLTTPDLEKVLSQPGDSLSFEGTTFKTPDTEHLIGSWLTLIGDVADTQLNLNGTAVPVSPGVKSTAFYLEGTAAELNAAFERSGLVLERLPESQQYALVQVNGTDLITGKQVNGIIGNASIPGAGPSPEPSVSPSPSPSPTPSPTFSPTSSATASITASPSATKTPSPTATPAPAGFNGTTGYVTLSAGGSTGTNMTVFGKGTLGLQFIVTPAALAPGNTRQVGWLNVGATPYNVSYNMPFITNIVNGTAQVLNAILQNPNLLQDIEGSGRPAGNVLVKAVLYKNYREIADAFPLDATIAAQPAPAPSLSPSPSPSASPSASATASPSPSPASQIVIKPGTTFYTKGGLHLFKVIL